MVELQDKKQHVVLDKRGGAISTWEYGGKSILHPLEGDVCGGMQFCWPNAGVVHPNHKLPVNGVLRTRIANNAKHKGVVFRGKDLLGPCFDGEEAEVSVLAHLHDCGFLYLASARLTDEASRKTVPINPGISMSFNTPEGKAHINVLGGIATYRLDRKIDGPECVPAGRGAVVTIPGLGEVHLLLQGALDTNQGHRLYFWRESLNYMRVQLALGPIEVYGKNKCTVLTHKRFEMGCTCQIFPE